MLVILTREVHQHFRRRRIATALLDEIGRLWPGHDIDPGCFTADGAALRHARTGRQVTATCTLPNEPRSRGAAHERRRQDTVRA